ncbi:peptidase domain-containing ABC transporter [Roseateles chitinivorans]|uniref:peptidase domain-containing ABC transporter n=1 Tax=Roseateles chitinivorans TaxID=2917965 RepID=UPI003D673D38
MRTILQSEAAECGLACLAMMADAHGIEISLRDLRARYPTSIKGATLRDLVQYATDLGFDSRAVSAELDGLAELTCPAILHWNLNHFVVLKHFSHRTGACTIVDPAHGEIVLALKEVSKSFTGIALELSPNVDFAKLQLPASPRLTLRALTAGMPGLGGAAARVAVVAASLQLFVLGGPLLNQFIVDDVVASGDHELLPILGLGFGLLLLSQCTVAWIRSWMLLRLGQSLSLQWAGNVFSHLLHLPLSFFEKRSMGDISSRFSSVQAIQRTVTSSLVEAVLDGITACVILALMLAYSVKLTLVACSAVVAYLALRLLTYAKIRDLTAEKLSAQAKESTHFLESLRAITPIRLYGIEGDRFSRWKSYSIDVQNKDFLLGTRNLAFMTINSLIFGFEGIACLWIGAGLVINSTPEVGVFTVGMLMAFVGFKEQFTRRMSTFINNLIDLRTIRVHLERLADIALEERESRCSTQPAAVAPPSGVLELRDVGFRYGEAAPWLLRGVNLQVQPGECVAITGRSGTGKTTLLKILLGILKPTRGQVLYSGVPIEQLGMTSYRRLIGAVMQDDALLAGSISENIAFFDSEVDEAKLRAAAALAQIDEDIERMPMRYETMIGDLGSGLSGGQKQRLILARAVYRSPSILAMDEATSHLDVSNEKLIAKALAELSVTRIIIAHRPDTIAMADRVVLLKEGRLHAAPSGQEVQSNPLEEEVA